jgi:hypothetical protein
MSKTFSGREIGEDKRSIFIKLSHLGQLFLLHLTFFTMHHQGPVLAVRKEDLGIAFGREDCGSLIYRGGFIPHQVVNNRDNEKYKELVIQNDIPPNKAIKQTDVSQSKEFWPFDDDIACVMPSSYLTDDRYHICLNVYVMLFKSTGSMLVKYNKPHDGNGFWMAGVSGLTNIIDVDIKSTQESNLIDTGKTLRNAAIRHCHEQVGKSVDINDLSAIGFVRKSSSDGYNPLGMVMAANICSPIQTNRLSDHVLATRFVKGADKIGQDVRDDDIEPWTKRILEEGVPGMARHILC